MSLSLKNTGRSLLAYGFALVLCLLITLWSLQLWKADWSVPGSYCADCLSMQGWIKGIIDNGWYLHNDFVGAPGGLDLHDYPVGSHNLHFLLFKIISLLRADYAFVFNIYVLLSFPLTVMSSLFVLRHFGFAYLTSLGASLLFGFLPYHFLRGLGGHLFLGCYFQIPLVVMVALWIVLHQPVLLRSIEGKLLPRLNLAGSKSLASVLVCVLLSSAEIYYAFFGCFIFFIAGVYTASKKRELLPVWTAMILIAIVAGGALLNELPTLLHRIEHGKNRAAVQRTLLGTEVFGLRVTQMLLPTSFHRLPLLAKKKLRYMSEVPLGNGDLWYLGVFGAMGFLVLLSRLVYKSAASSDRGLLEPLTVFNISAVLFATVGGFGLLFGIFVSPWIRCYERMSIYIAFLSFFALVILIEPFVRKYAVTARSRLTYCVLVSSAVILGFFDQTSDAFVPRYAELRKEYQSDSEFVCRIEETLGSGAMVFQLPYLPYPESFPVCHMQDYEPIKGYLHSKTLRWSYGAMRGREGDRWLVTTCCKPIEELVATIVDKGFTGIYVDRYGYPDAGEEVAGKLTKLLGKGPQVSANQRVYFFDLRSYRQGSTYPVAAQR